MAFTVLHKIQQDYLNRFTIWSITGSKNNQPRSKNWNTMVSKKCFVRDNVLNFQTILFIIRSCFISQYIKINAFFVFCFLTVKKLMKQNFRQYHGLYWHRDFKSHNKTINDNKWKNCVKLIPAIFSTLLYWANISETGFQP